MENSTPTDQTSRSQQEAAATQQAPTTDNVSLQDVDTTIPDLPTWTASDYESHIKGSGALKLADSGVAPLIAAARGYKRIDADNFAAEKKIMKVTARSNQGRRMERTLASDGLDGMQMPWYSAADIHIAFRQETQVEPHTYQVRPAVPEDNEHGKPIKYEFIAKGGSPLDIHPATPVAWIDQTPVTMFAEGLLKGDAALSAYLHSNGVPYSELVSEGVTDPVAKLRGLLESIPEADRVLIVSVGGIYNTTQNPIDWREINLRGRTGWIAFDADLESNPFVHRAAVELQRRLLENSKMTKVLFLNPRVVGGEQGETSKYGVDDYLAKVGSWKQLTSRMMAKLPNPPKRSDDETPGNWRIHPKGLFAEECHAVMDGVGGSVGRYEWRRVLDLGGRVLSLESRRQPTDQEIKTGLFNANVHATDIDESNVEIEVSWHANGVDQSAVVTGSKSILNYPPADWDRKGAEIPDSLLLHRLWPPRGAKGEQWITAVKGNRSEDTARKTRWMQMGWVPVEHGSPVFLIGDQVVGDTEVVASAVSGVDESMLRVAPHFGVGSSLEGDLEDETYREIVRSDFRDVIDAYIHSKAWTDPTTAALVLAGALRPSIPLRPRTTLYFWGPAGGGKSWTAKCMMYFWARNLGDWHDKLPASAKDTGAYLEASVSMAPIWVVDDMAPSVNKRQAESEMAKLEDLTRAIFNNASKGRMNADMTSKKVNKPITQLILTAENELNTPSVKERLIPAYIGRGKLNPSSDPTDAIDQMSMDEGTQARFTSHVIKYLRGAAVNYAGGWAAYMDGLESKRSELQASAKTLMRERGASAGSLQRTTSLAADLMLTFAVLQSLASELDMDREFVQMLGVEDGLGGELVNIVFNAHADNQNATPGRSLIRALSALLASGGAHVVSAENPTRPPIEGATDSEAIMNQRLGWMPGGAAGEMRPGGPSIGTVITLNHTQVILFDAETAFSKAQASYPHLIQYGQGTGSAWASIWDEGLSPDFIVRRANSRGTMLSTYRARVGSQRISGIPLEVGRIISGSLTIDDLENDSTEDGR